jgi:hypothetical protein
MMDARLERGDLVDVPGLEPALGREVRTGPCRVGHDLIKARLVAGQDCVAQRDHVSGGAVDEARPAGIDAERLVEEWPVGLLHEQLDPTADGVEVGVVGIALDHAADDELGAVLARDDLGDLGQLAVDAGGDGALERLHIVVEEDRHVGQLGRDVLVPLDDVGAAHRRHHAPTQI